MVHLLSHLSAECIKFGPLDRFSCWKYENTLKSLKERCRNFKTPLTALANQMRAKSTFTSQASAWPLSRSCGILLKRMYEGLHLLSGEAYKTVVYKNHVLTVDAPDCYFMDSKMRVFMIKDIVRTGAGVKLLCQHYDRTTSAYYLPTEPGRFESSELGIVELQHASEDYKIIPIEHFVHKCVVRMHDSKLYSYPIMRLI